MSVPFIGKFQLLNVILDQFVDCKFIIHYYRQLTVHKLVKNCIQKFFSTAFLWFTIDAPTYHIFINWPQHPWWPKLEKEAMAALIGLHWRHVETIFTKFKLLNVILVQFMGSNVFIMIYYGIAIHKLVQNYV